MRTAAPVTLMPIILGGYAVKAFSRSPLLEKLVADLFAFPTPLTPPATESSAKP